jgi:hypothetical protein
MVRGCAMQLSEWIPSTPGEKSLSLVADLSHLIIQTLPHFASRTESTVLRESLALDSERAKSNQVTAVTRDDGSFIDGRELGTYIALRGSYREGHLRSAAQEAV